MKTREIAGSLMAQDLTFGIVISRFNDLFTQQLLRGALDCFQLSAGSFTRKQSPVQVQVLVTRVLQELILSLRADISIELKGPSH